MIQLFEKWAEETAITVKSFPHSGSNRQYFRIQGITKKAIGVHNPIKDENEAFMYLTNHFHSKKFQVPEIYSTDLKNNIYLQQDMGDVTLFRLVIEEQKNNTFSNKLVEYYKEVISQLIKFQINGHIGLDYSKCYPNIDYGKEYIQWDLN
ncbi:MAG: phosphotransferase, partial [Bacteroidales bacterium]|nr:phosphotransferase [Bacteroidales bacterium]